MTDLVSHFTLPLLSKLIEANMGLHFPRERWPDIERAMVKAAPEFGFEDPESCAQWLLSIPLEEFHVEKLAEHLTVRESHFFRDSKLFQVLEGRILPEIIESRRKAGKRLRIWSAGCATGEEPFTIAVTLTRALPDIDGWRVDILGTDINTSSLEKAGRGVYTEWSFRGIPEWVKETYFTRTPEGHYEIVPRIKRLVRFSRHNLATDEYPPASEVPGDVDLIFCRNVIMYFAPDRMQSVVGNLSACLAGDGWLAVAAVEADQVRDPALVSAGFPGVILYKKGGTQPADPTGHQSQSPVLGPGPPANGDSSIAVEHPLHSLGQHEAELGDCFDPATMEQEVSQQPTLTVPEAERQANTRPIEAEIQPLDPEPGQIDSEHSGAPALDQDQESEVGRAVSLARAHGDRGDLAEALEWCEKAIAAEKLNPGHYYLQGTILNDLGRIEEAVASMKKALYLAPEMAVAHFALGNLTRRLGKHKESAKHFQTVLAVLDHRPKDEIVVESEGITAGRLAEIVQAMASQETLHDEQ